MSDQNTDPVPSGRPPVRFEATVQPGDGERDLDRVADLDLDRIPDPEGEVRLLVTMDDCVQLLDRGFRVQLHRPLPVRPLDPGLIESDESARAWLDERVRGIERAEES
jgi:hypothetical protein